MDAENLQKLENLDKVLVNIKSLLKAGKALEGSKVTTLDLDQRICRLTSQLNAMVPSMTFEGNDSLHLIRRAEPF